MSQPAFAGYSGVYRFGVSVVYLAEGERECVSWCHEVLHIRCLFVCGRG